MIKTNNGHYQSILKIFSELTYSRDTWEIFYDFMEMSAICISNAVDFKNYDKREKQYLSTISKYPLEHQRLFSKMFAELTLALEHEYQVGGFTDILGSLFHELELHNKYKGQFFTPQNICTMIGKMLLWEHDKAIQEVGCISVLEPACGSGAMLLGFTQAMKERGYNHSQQLSVSAIDIDLKCVYMCYIQLSLYGIPAIVIHGDSLTLGEWSRWYTPVYLFEGWNYKRKHHSIKQQIEDIELQNEIIIPTSKEVMNSFEQLDLFK